ncbi:hypothetical protein [Streptomyces sp. NPDC052225]|uniref:hypothetical protein n=1 Tax=Streptomyces sp. NPDC052225 TaxID=3154949 RepID=UPI0034343837
MAGEVKGWLLVLPQLLLTSLLVGGTTTAGGVAGLLAFCAAVGPDDGHLSAVPPRPGGARAARPF